MASEKGAHAFSKTNLKPRFGKFEDLPTMCPHTSKNMEVDIRIISFESFLNLIFYFIIQFLLRYNLRPF